MGIVVSVIMFLGLCFLLPVPFVKARLLAAAPSSANSISGLLLLGGLWNSVWFGLQNIIAFWGIAALVSGVFMVLAALLVFVPHGSGRLQELVWLQKAHALIHPMTSFLLICLSVCFLLYAVTLVQLNLGMPILQ
jgi:hypothetical protein